MWTTKQSYPTYSWGIYPTKTVYENQDMLDAIEIALKNMTRYPDAEKIISRLKYDGGS